MVGRYPRDELWRIGVGLCAIAAYGGVLAGYVQRMREVTGRETPSVVPLATHRRPGVRDLAADRRVVVLLSLTTTPGPTVLTVLVIASASSAASSAAFATRRWLLPIVAVGIVGPIAHRVVPQQAGAVERVGRDDAQPLPRRAGIALSFPLGVLLALGRRAGRRTDSLLGGIVVAVPLAVAGARPARPSRHRPRRRDDVAARRPRRRPRPRRVSHRPDVHAAARPGRIDRLHRVLPRRAAVRALLLGGIALGLLPAPRVRDAGPGREGDRRVHPVHRRLHRRDRARRAAVAAAGRPRPPRRSGSSR